VPEPSIHYEFPQGLPAFERETNFRLLEPPAIHPLALLESLSTPGLRFVCIAIHWLVPSYRFELSDDEKSNLQGDQDLKCLALVTFPENGSPTANLRAPVLLNPVTRRGLQSIQTDSSYDLFHPLHPDPPKGPSCS